MHDRMRPDVNGEGTYDRIVKNLQYCVAHRNGEEYYVRGTFTRYNMDFTTDVEDMLDHGFPAVSMEPVVGEDTEAYSIKEEDLPRVKAEYDRLAKLFIQREEEGRPFFFFHFNMDLWKGPCLPKRLRGCGAGHEYLAVVPNGDIYPCHQFVGNEEWKMGTLETGTVDQTMNVWTAGRNSSAPADAMPTTRPLPAISTSHTILPAKSRRSVWNAP